MIGIGKEGSTTTPSHAQRASSTASPELSSPWANIEDHLRAHDENFIKKYGNDMDTLLVFAGLYSANVTTFIIEFYKLLQPDSSQVTVELLSRISSQLENRTVGSLSASTISQFTPSTTSTWINALWFTGLLLSLAAALFAMVVKRWLREYGLWTSYSANPSEVVVLRQLRSQAWERWQVPGILGAIPALLEFSLVLFLCGMVILLWTLDKVVAIVLTIFTGIFLTILFALLVLPTVSNECPYKSPLGWACVLVWQRVVQLLPLGIKKSWSAYRHAQLSAKTWIKRDLYRTIGVPRHSEDVERDKRAEYAAQVVIPLVQALIWVKEDSEDKTVLNSVEHCTRTIHQVADRLIAHVSAIQRNPGQILLHRLDTAIFATSKLLKIDIATLHGALQDQYHLLQPERVGRSAYVSWMKCVCRSDSTALVDVLRPAVTSRALLRPTSMTSSENEEIKTITYILLSALDHVLEYMFPDSREARAEARGEKASTSTSPTAIALDATVPPAHATTSPATTSPPANSILPVLPSRDPSFSSATSASTLADRLEPFMPELEPFRLSSPEYHIGAKLFIEEQCEFVKVFCLMETVLLLCHQAGYRTDYLDHSIKAFIQLTTKMYFHLNAHADREFDEAHPGLRTVLFQTLCRLGNPEGVVHGIFTIHDRTMSGLKLDTGRDDSSRYALLASRLFHANVTPEDRHMFIVTADMAFSAIERMQNVDALVMLVEHACEAAKIAMEKRWANCGCYHDLPWIRTLLKVTQGETATQSRASRSLFFPWKRMFKLLDCLDRTLLQKLLTGPSVRRDLKQLRFDCDNLVHRFSMMLPGTEATPPPVADSIRDILTKTPFPELPVVRWPRPKATRTPEGTVSHWRRSDERHVRRPSISTSNSRGGRRSIARSASYFTPLPASSDALFPPLGASILSEPFSEMVSSPKAEGSTSSSTAAIVDIPRRYGPLDSLAERTHSLPRLPLKSALKRTIRVSKLLEPEASSNSQHINWEDSDSETETNISVEIEIEPPSSSEDGDSLEDYRVGFLSPSAPPPPLPPMPAPLRPRSPPRSLPSLPILPPDTARSSHSSASLSLYSVTDYIDPAFFADDLPPDSVPLRSAHRASAVEISEPSMPPSHSSSPSDENQSLRISDSPPNDAAYESGTLIPSNGYFIYRPEALGLPEENENGPQE